MCQLGTIVFEPVEKLRVPQQPVFHDLAVARQKIACSQRLKHIHIRQNKRGLVKRTDQVFALRRVYPRLAANRAVNLRQERGRDLNKAHATPQRGSRKACQIAYNTTAKSNHKILAFDFLRQKPFHRALKMRPAFGRLARGQDQRLRGDTRRRQSRLQPVQMRRRDVFIRHDHHPLAVTDLPNQRASLRQKARTDQNIISTALKADVDCFHD